MQLCSNSKHSIRLSKSKSAAFRFSKNQQLLQLSLLSPSLCHPPRSHQVAFSLTFPRPCTSFLTMVLSLRSLALPELPLPSHLLCPPPLNLLLLGHLCPRSPPSLSEDGFFSLLLATISFCHHFLVCNHTLCNATPVDESLSSLC